MVHAKTPPSSLTYFSALGFQPAASKRVLWCLCGLFTLFAEFWMSRSGTLEFSMDFMKTIVTIQTIVQYPKGPLNVNVFIQ